jgi:hypothetical protein
MLFVSNSSKYLQCIHVEFPSWNRCVFWWSKNPKKETPGYNEYFSGCSCVRSSSFLLPASGRCPAENMSIFFFQPFTLSTPFDSCGLFCVLLQHYWCRFSDLNMDIPEPSSKDQEFFPCLVGLCAPCFITILACHFPLLLWSKFSRHWNSYCLHWPPAGCALPTISTVFLSPLKTCQDTLGLFSHFIVCKNAMFVKLCSWTLTSTLPLKRPWTRCL